MLKFCKTSQYGLRCWGRFFLGGGERGCFAPQKGVMLHPRAMDFQEKNILCELNTYCKLL